MRHLLRALAVLAWDFIACRDERAANEARPTVFDAHCLDALAVAELVADEEPTPLHDRLVCEAIEKAEGWVS